MLRTCVTYRRKFEIICDAHAPKPHSYRYEMARPAGGRRVIGQASLVHNRSLHTRRWRIHSEVAALALFMDAWFGESASERNFDDARLIIEGTNDGKLVHDLREDE